MQLSQMRYFIEIAKTCNISAAAKKLYLSQPSLSQSIRALEAEIGIPLLIRHPKSVSLTDAGEQFLIHAERIIGSTDQLQELMQKHSRLLSGNLRLGIPWIAGYLGIFPLIRRYNEAMPGIRYELSIQGSQILMNQLLQRSIHAAFLVNLPPEIISNEELYYQLINEETYFAWVHRKYPLAQKDTVLVSDLADYPLIMPSRDSIFYKQLSYIMEENGLVPRILCETSLSTTVSQMAAEGLGIGFASESIAKKICPDTCRVIPLEHSVSRTLYYVTLTELLDYPTIESFTNYVKHYRFDARNQS